MGERRVSKREAWGHFIFRWILFPSCSTLVMGREQPPSCPMLGSKVSHRWPVVSSCTSFVTLRKSRSHCRHLPLKMEMAVLNLSVNTRSEWHWLLCNYQNQISWGVAWDRMPVKTALVEKDAEWLVTGRTGTHLRGALLGNSSVLQASMIVGQKALWWLSHPWTR